jgi:hypothetical protein
MWALKEIIRKLPADELTGLKKALRLESDGKDVSRLLQRLDNSERTRKLFSELSTGEKNVLRYLFSQGGSATEREVLDFLPEAPPALEKLKEAPIIFADPETGSSDGAVWCVPREYARFIPLTPAEKSTLANLLARQPAPYFSALAQAHGGAEGDRRAVATSVKGKWLNEETLKTALEMLNAEERSLWKIFLESEGVVDTKNLSRHGVTASVQPAHLDQSRPLDHLYALGLVFPNQFPHPSCFLIPSDVFSAFRGKPFDKTFSAVDHGPAQLRSWGLRILSDLQLYAAYQASGRLQFTQNDIPLRHQLRAFLKAVGVDEEPYGLFLNASLGAFFAKMVKKDSQTLDANPAESMSRLIAFWRDHDHWQESSHVRDAARSPDGQLDRTLKSKRLVVLKALEELPTRAWVAYEDFEAHVFSRGWKRVDSGIQSNTAYYHNERWPRKEAVADLSAQQTLSAMTAECLTWLGLVDVGVGRARKDEWALTHLRLTEWGRQFLDKKSGRFEPLPPVVTENKFRVLPNLEIQASPRLRPDLLAELFKLAALKGVNTFSLTKASLREALDEGRKADELLDFLKTHSSTPLPAMVTQFVDEVGQKHGHIKLGLAGAYLEVDDPLLLVELKAQRSLQDIFRKQIGDRLTILNDSDLERIAKALRKLGYFPVVEKSVETERFHSKFHW